MWKRAHKRPSQNASTDVKPLARKPVILKPLPGSSEKAIEGVRASRVKVSLPKFSWDK